MNFHFWGGLGGGISHSLKIILNLILVVGPGDLYQICCSFPGLRCEPVARADVHCVHFNSTHAEVWLQNISKTITEAAGAPGSGTRMNL